LKAKSCRIGGAFVGPKGEKGRGGTIDKGVLEEDTNLDGEVSRRLVLWRENTWRVFGLKGWHKQRGGKNLVFYRKR